MINFQELQLEVHEKYSFVGIERRGSKIIFCLPTGFNLALFTTYESKRDLFFLLYRVLSNFKEICLQKGYLQFDDGIKTQDRDGVIRNRGSIQRITLPDVEIENNILYSKLDLIGSILSAYDEPKILSLVYRLGKSEEIDYSKLHLFLHHAVYLDNGVAYIDAMTRPRQMIRYQPTDIVGLYCYILINVKQQLHEEVSGEVAALAEQFKHTYIGIEDGLFQEEYSRQTVDSLKDALQLINRNTAFKDADYWYFYDAIELFLYGELSQADEGEIWGIKNFYSVWESMCLTYLAKTVLPEYILHLDTTFISNKVTVLANSKTKVLDLTKAFSINGSQLLPDAVVFPFAFSNSRYIFPNTYSLRKNAKNGVVWDDYGYKTAFYCKVLCSFEEIWVRIVYEGQLPSENHTILELEKIYGCRIPNHQLIINSKLPSNFYSFWTINPDNLNPQLLSMMFQLNHFFYIALSKNIFSAEKFKDFLLEKTQSDSLFRNSLFRDHKKTDEIVEMFRGFLNQHTEYCFKVVDVKYLELNYFFDIDNRRHLKERSIRKQFTYEYLLQGSINNNNDYKDLEIKSIFWLPSWKNNSCIVEKVNSQYLDGYIYLENINFACLVSSYFD